MIDCMLTQKLYEFWLWYVIAEGECELCQVPGVPLDQDAGAHLQDLGQHARRGEVPQQSPNLSSTPPVPSSGQPLVDCCPPRPRPFPPPPFSSAPKS